MAKSTKGRARGKGGLAAAENEFGPVSSWEGSFDDVDAAVRARHVYSAHLPQAVMARLCLHLDQHGLVDSALDPMCFGVAIVFDDQEDYKARVDGTLARHEAYLVDAYPHEEGPREILPFDLRRVTANLRRLGRPLPELEEALGQ